MVKTLIVVSVLVLGWTFTLQGEPAAEHDHAQVNETEAGISPKVGPEVVCTEAPETGPCRMEIPRYFYNPATQSCENFTYGGCDGNHNNFETEKACLQTCRPADICEADPVEGNITCLGYFPHFFYNSTSQTCEGFVYGGCGGTGNNFETERECQLACQPNELCQAKPDPGPCKAFMPQYHFNSTSKMCEMFIYGGCLGNQNRFSTEEMCLEACRKEQKPAEALPEPPAESK
ncbi:kunitz-type serine protease inhibitor A-like [Aulostomus maculatus]